MCTSIYTRRQRYNSGHCYETVPTRYAKCRRVLSNKCRDVRPTGIGDAGTDATGVDSRSDGFCPQWQSAHHPAA
jgi:hypothetical protein